MKLYILILLLFALNLVSYSQDTKFKLVRLSDSLPLNPKIKQGILQNGLTYYLVNSNDKPGKLLLNFHLKAGAYQEDTDQAEAAHFVEHLVLRRSKQFSTLNSFRDYLQSGGVFVSNASTQLEVTNFFFEAPGDTSLLTNIFGNIRGWLSGQAILDDVDILATKEIISEETKPDVNSPLIFEKFHTRLLEPSRFSVVRLQSEKLKRRYATLSNTAIRRFYNDWYRPDLAAFVIVGDFNVDTMERMIKEMFAGLTNPVYERIHVDYPFVLSDDNRYFVEFYPSSGGNNIYLNFYFKQEHRPLTTFEDYKRLVVTDLFNDMVRRRLVDLYSQSSASFSLYATFSKGMAAIENLGIDALNFGVRCGRASEIETSFKSLFSELERLKRYGFDAEELERSRSRLLALINRSRAPGSDLREESDLCKASFLYNEVALSREDQEQLNLKYVSEITVQDINDQTKAWMGDSNRDIAILAPRRYKSDIPHEKLVMDWFHQIQERTLEKYQKKRESNLRINFDSLYSLPCYSNYARQDRENGITQLQLKNGVRVVLKQAVSSSSNRINLHGSRPVGLSRYSNPADYISGRLAVDLILTAGLGELSQEELMAYQKAHHLSTSFVMSEAESVLSGAATKDELDALFQVVYRYFLPPRTDSINFERNLNRIKQNYNKSKTHMESELVSLVGGHFYLGQGFSLAELNMLDWNLCLKNYADCFTVPGEFLFVLTGIQDMNKTVELAVKYLGNLPTQNGPPPNMYASNAFRHSSAPAKISKMFVNRHHQKDQAIVWLLFPCAEGISVREHLSLDFLMKILEYVAYRRLREKEGGVYSYVLGTQEVGMQSGKNRYVSYLNFGCHPDAVERLVAAAMDEISRLRANGPTTNDLSAARALKKEHMNDAFWVSYLAELYRLSDPSDLIADLEALIDDIGIKEVQQAAQHYLSEDCFLRCIELPRNYNK